MQAVHARGRPFRFKAGGYSMAPFIRDGDLVVVSPPISSLPGPGEVVAFLHPETGVPCIHRVLSIGHDDFLTQGDNRPQRPDGRIRREALLGRVTRVERNGKRIRLGLGPERRLLALLSRKDLLVRLRRCVGALSALLGRGRAS
jgi:hypothetical protein